jgi:hypothetical protein
VLAMENSIPRPDTVNKLRSAADAALPCWREFLVKGDPSYIGNRHANIAKRWTDNLETAKSIRTGVPQAKLDFSNAPQAQLETFLRNINANTLPAARSLLEKYDLSSAKTLVDVGSV